jgi:hypothetical protein
MVSWPFSSFPVLFEIGTSFQQPGWFHGGFSALLEIGTHSSNQNGFMALFQLPFR